MRTSNKTVLTARQGGVLGTLQLDCDYEKIETPASVWMSRWSEASLDGGGHLVAVTKKPGGDLLRITVRDADAPALSDAQHLLPT